MAEEVRKRVEREKLDFLNNKSKSIEEKRIDFEKERAFFNIDKNQFDEEKQKLN